MYFPERMMAMLSYVLLLTAIALWISKSHPKHIGALLFFYMTLLTAMAYFYQPASGADLYRLIPLMRMWAKLSVRTLVSEMIASATPVYVIYMHLIGRFQLDGLLPAITCFLFYHNVFYVLKKSVAKYQSSPQDAALALLFFMSTGAMIEVISGIRTMLGFSYVAVCIYREMVEGMPPYRNIVAYVFASLLHPAALILTAIRFAFMGMEIVYRSKQRTKNLLMISIPCLLMFYFGKDYLNASVAKTKEYLMGSTYFYPWEYLIGWIQLIAIGGIQLLSLRRAKQGQWKEERWELLKFSLLMTLILVVTCFEYNTFHRFEIFLSILSIPLLLHLCKAKDLSRIDHSKLRRSVFLISCILLGIACARGNLSSLKFFVLP